jgi:hypothetical protein
MFLAGFKFVRNTQEINNSIIEVKCKKSVLDEKKYNYEKYNFGRNSMCFCVDTGLVKINYQSQEGNMSFAYIKLSTKVDSYYPQIEISSECVDDSIFTFSAYYFLYTIGYNVIAIPGVINNVGTELCVINQNSGSKVIFFLEHDCICLHEFGNEEVFEFNNKVLFSGYPESDLRYLMFNHGSRPFWSNKAMVKWLEFIDTIYNLSDLES